MSKSIEIQLNSLKAKLSELTLRYVVLESNNNKGGRDLHEKIKLVRDTINILEDNKDVDKSCDDLNIYGQRPISEEFERVDCRHNCRQPKGWIRAIICDSNKCEKWKK